MAMHARITTSDARHLPVEHLVEAYLRAREQHNALEDVHS